MPVRYLSAQSRLSPTHLVCPTYVAYRPLLARQRHSPLAPTLSPHQPTATPTRSSPMSRGTYPLWLHADHSPSLAHSASQPPAQAPTQASASHSPYPPQKYSSPYPPAASSKAAVSCCSASRSHPTYTRPQQAVGSHSPAGK